MVLAIGAALVAALVIRQSGTRDVLRRLALVAGVALGLRLLAVTVIYLIAIQTHGEGTWLQDEASFYLATESLLPNPFDKALPEGLGHLGGDTYLGITTTIAVALGRMDTVAFRLLNATLGTLVAVMIAVIAKRLVGAWRPAVAAGLAVAVWPTLILWSATFLRDTLASFIAVVVWWALVSYRQVLNPRLLSIVILGMLMVAGVRPYLAGAMAIGLGAWALYPIVVSAPRRLLAASVAVAVVLGVALSIQQARHIDQATHELFYRQMTTRMETLGRLYTPIYPDTPPQEPPFGPGAPVALTNADSGWVLAGLVQQPAGPGLVQVAFTDGSIRTERIADLTLLQSIPLSPWQLLASFWPGVVGFLIGTGSGGDTNSPAWIAEAIAGDVLLALAVVGGMRARISIREWLFPACVVLGTAAALIAVPGAPGNDDRHRAAQTVPLLSALAAGCLVSIGLSRLPDGAPNSSPTSSPRSATTPLASRKRSLREAS